MILNICLFVLSFFFSQVLCVHKYIRILRIFHSIEQGVIDKRGCLRAGHPRHQRKVA